MNDYASDLNQNEYYNNIVDNKIPVNVFLINGVKLYGTIEGYDSHTITLSGNKGTNTVQLVYKHAISTIQIYNQAI